MKEVLDALCDLRFALEVEQPDVGLMSFDASFLQTALETAELPFPTELAPGRTYIFAVGSDFRLPTVLQRLQSAGVESDLQDLGPMQAIVWRDGATMGMIVKPGSTPSNGIFVNYL